VIDLPLYIPFIPNGSTYRLGEERALYSRCAACRMAMGGRATHRALCLGLLQLHYLAGLGDRLGQAGRLNLQLLHALGEGAYQGGLN